MKHVAVKFGLPLVLVLLMLFESPIGLANSSTIRIGEIDPLTGKLAKHGQEIHEGILYAVEEANARGGIKGRKVELISRDDQSQPEVAINQTEDLLYREKVVGLVGGYVDSLVGPISELAAKHHTPYVASASLQRGLTLGRNNPFFFRVAHLDGILKPLCDFIANDLRPQKAAILYAATPGANEFGREVRTCLQRAGIDIPIYEKFRPGFPDFSAFLLKLRRSKADVLISGAFFPDHLVLVRQIREQNIPLKFYLGPWGIAYPSFLEAMGESSEGLFGMCAWNPGITLPGTEKASEIFQQGFTSRFGKVANTTTMHGYTSAKALLRAIEGVMETGNEITGENISNQLRSLDLVLPMEHLLFDEKGDPRRYQQVIVQVQNGRMVTVHPPERATGQVIETNAR
jgi:branched-chain amino acid transport system substrate-binding protein